MFKHYIYHLVLILYLTLLVSAKKDSIEDCDEDDLECLEDYTTAIATTAFITHSSSSFGESSSTVMSAAATEVLSDFHEAKLVNPRPNRPERTPVGEQTAGSVQDKNNVDLSLDSGSAGLSNTIDESTASGLSKVEAGVLSACGILVVAGIAVGIFVWKNTTHRRNFREGGAMADLEQNHNFDASGGNPMAIKEAPLQKVPQLAPSVTSQKLENSDLASSKSTESLAFIQKQLQQQMEEEERLQLQQLKQTHIDLSLPNIGSGSDDDYFSSWGQQELKSATFQNQLEQVVISDKQATVIQDEIVTAKMEHTSEKEITSSKVEEVVCSQEEKEQTSIEATVDSVDSTPQLVADEKEESRQFEEALVIPNVQTNSDRPSALDPAFDPTAVTYPLQKFLHTPTQSFKSPMQISVDLGSDQEEEEEDNDEDLSGQDIMHTDSSVTNTAEGPSISKAAETAYHLNRQLTKMFSPTGYPPIALGLESNDSEDKASIDTRAHGKLPTYSLRSSKDLKSLGEEDEKSFVCPLDLPEDQYVPMHNSSGVPLVSRAQVLADPVKRLGQDEIALWEENCRKKVLHEMWDEQVQKEEMEEEKEEANKE